MVGTSRFSTALIIAVKLNFWRMKVSGEYGCVCIHSFGLPIEELANFGGGGHGGAFAQVGTGGEDGMGRVDDEDCHPIN